MVHHKTDERQTLNPQQEDKTIQESIDDFSDLDSGWAWMILLASFGTNFLMGNSVYAAGIVHSTLLERYGESVSLTSWAVALQSTFLNLAGPVSSLVSDRFSCRTAIVLSGALYLIGYLSTAFSPNVKVAIFTFGVLTGMGAGIGYPASIVVIGFNFKKRRNLALGVAATGIGAGMFVLAPLTQMARETYGPTGFFLILASVTSNIIAFGIMCFPSKLEIHTQLERIRDARLCSGTNAHFAVPYFKVLANKAMICLFLCMFCYCLGTYTIFMFIPSYVVSTGYTPIQAAFVVSLSGIVSIFGRLLTGILASLDKLNEIFLYSGSMTLIGIATFVYPFMSHHFAGHVTYMVILGLLFGCCYITATPVSLKFVEIKYVAIALGLQYFFGGIGALVGPVGAGVLVDLFGSFKQSIIVAAVFILIGSGFGFLTMCCKQTFSQRIETDIQITRSSKTDDLLSREIQHDGTSDTEATTRIL